MESVANAQNAGGNGSLFPLNRISAYVLPSGRNSLELFVIRVSCEKVPVFYVAPTVLSPFAKPVFYKHVIPSGL